MNRKQRRAMQTGRTTPAASPTPAAPAAPPATPPAVAPPAPANGRAVTTEQAVALALHHHQAGQLAQAEDIYRKILQAFPDQPDALHLLGLIENSRGNLELAATLISRSLVANPTLADAHNNLGTVLKKLNRLDEAIASYQRAIACRPDFAPAYSNLGNALQAQLRIQDAVTAYRTAIALQPDYRQGHVNLATLLRDEGFAEEALATFDRAVAMQPDDLVVRFDRGLANLVAGNLLAGWEEYELRWDQDHLRPHRKAFAQPQWQGEDPAGKVILVHGEQGFGDTLQFARYVPLLAERGARVILAVQPQLHRLMATLPGVAHRHVSGEVPPPFHMHIPLISLPRLFRTTLETIPAKVPYVAAEPELVARWSERMGPRTGKLRVGIVWAGVHTFKADARRSPRLPAMLPLFDVPGVEFFGLQMGDGRRDMADWTMPGNFTDLGGEITDFTDSAAIMENLDLVISSCTAPAHLAGALGKPLWLLLYSAADWRWLYDREDSPWYPSARLFRQNRHGIGGWAPVIGRVGAALAALAAGNRAQLLPHAGQRGPVAQPV